jgi:hypothetical protein
MLVHPKQEPSEEGGLNTQPTTKSTGPNLGGPWHRPSFFLGPPPIFQHMGNGKFEKEKKKISILNYLIFWEKEKKNSDFYITFY